MQPLVSVIMPSFNARGTLPRAAASLIAQTYENWECVFVDDGSTDGSFEWICQIGDPRFRCFRNALNQGRGATRQLGLEKSRGEYICMLDADDWYYPQKLQRQVDCVEADPMLVLVSADLAIGGPRPQAVWRASHGEKTCITRSPQSSGSLFCPIAHSNGSCQAGRL